MIQFSLFLLSLPAALLVANVRALWPVNSLAVTPQMGWDNWNAFACDVSEDLLLGTAKKIVSYGLRDAGYHYVVLDDCWSAGRNLTGFLEYNSTKFPNGMKHIADQLHNMGLGFGMYSDAGTYTCGRYAGSLGYEQKDADLWASWGVDYLKYDNCYNEGISGTPEITFNRYKTMGKALNATGRQILYSLCNWGEDFPWKWGQTLANSWRISGDIYDSFDRPDRRCPCTGDEGYNCALPGFHCSMMNILNKVTAFVDKGIPHAWNDLDMLEVGNGGMTDDEYRTHFSMWAAVKSPLLMGNNIDKLKPLDLSILNNPAVIAVNQDPAGSSAVRVWRYYVDDTDRYGQGEIQLWSGSLSGGDQVVVLLNAGNSSRTMNATLEDIFYDSGPEGTAPQTKVTWDIHDLWANRMDEVTAKGLIDGNAGPVTGANVTSFYYNATKTSYAEGLSQNNTLLLGMVTGQIGPGPLAAISTTVPRHGVAMMRLRIRSSSASHDEL